MQYNRPRDTETRSPVVAWLTSRRKKTSTDKRPPIPWGAGPGLTSRQQQKNEQLGRKPMHTMNQNNLDPVYESTPRNIPLHHNHRAIPPAAPEQAFLLDALRDAIRRNAELQAAAATMNGHTSQPQQQQQPLSPIAAAISLDISNHTPPSHTNNKQLYAVFAPEKSPIFMTSRHRALHCEMDDPSKRLPYIWGRSFTRKTPLEWVKAKLTACFSHQYFDDDVEYIVPLQQSTGTTVGGTPSGAVESTVVNRQAFKNAAASGVSVGSEEAVSIDGTGVVDVESAAAHVQEEEYREPTPLPKLTIHMSPLRTSVAQLPLDEQGISMLRMSLLLGGRNHGTPTNDNDGGGVISGDDIDDREASPPRFADLLGLGEGGMHPPPFAFQPPQHAATSTASSPQKAVAAAKPSSSTATSSGGGSVVMKPLRQTTLSLSQLLAVTSGDAARRTPTAGHHHQQHHEDNRAMARSKINITERLSEMKGFTSAPSSPRRMMKQKITTTITGMVATGGDTAVAPPPQQARAARVPPASAPATPLEKLLKPAVVPRMNKASQARAMAVRERLEKMAGGKDGDVKTKKKKSSHDGSKSTSRVAPTPQMNYSQLLDRHNNNNNNMSHQQQQEIALRLSSTSLALSKLSEQALVAAAAKAAGVDIATYQKNRQQYIQMLSRLAIGLTVDPAVLKQSKLPSPPPPSSVTSASESSSSGGNGGGKYQAEKAVVPTIKDLPTMNSMHGTTYKQPPLSPNHAYGLKHDYGDGGETARGKVHQRLVSMTDVAAVSKKEKKVDVHVNDGDHDDRIDMIKAKRGEMGGNNNKMMKTEVSIAVLLEKSLREGGGNGNGGLKVTDSLTFAELEARGITLKDLLRVRVAMP